MDFVCLQEAHVPRNGADNQVIALSNQLGLSAHLWRALSESHLDVRSDAAIGVIGRIAPVRSTYVPLPNPHLAMRRPDGGAWFSFDKGYLVCEYRLEGRGFFLVTGHAFPFHVFGRSALEQDFIDIHRTLERTLLDCFRLGPTIFAGDLNYSYPHQIMPGLKEGDWKSVLPPTPTVPIQSLTTSATERSDQIFVSRHFNCIQSDVVVGEADHFLCWAELAL